MEAMTGIKCETFDDCKAAAKVCQLPAVRLSTPHDTWRLLSLSGLELHDTVPTSAGGR